MTAFDVPESVPTAPALGARIDRLPACGPVWACVVRISIGAFFEIYEVALTGLLGPMLTRAGIFHAREGFLGLPDLATLAFATFGGLFLGVLLFSAIADRYGRRPVMTLAPLAYGAATLVMATQGTAAGICFWRFVAAIGVGAEVVVVDSYLAEVLPKALRGRGFAVSKAIQYTAVPVATALAALCARDPDGGWRLLLFGPVVGAPLVLWVRRCLPESSRWLELHGREGEAMQIMVTLEEAVRHSGPLLGPPPAAAAPPRSLCYAALFVPPLRRRLMMMMVASGASSLAYYGFANWLPSMIEARGVVVTRSLAYTALIACAYPLAPLCFYAFADRIERKWQIMVGAGIVVVSGVAFAEQSDAAGWILFGLLVGMGNNLVAYASHAYRSELFPTALRGRAIGLIYSLDRLVAAFSSYGFAWLLLNLGVQGVLVSVAGCALLDMAVVGLLGPRTLRLASEDIGNDAGAQ